MHTPLSLGIPAFPGSLRADPGCSKPSPSAAAALLLPVQRLPFLAPALPHPTEFLVLLSFLKGWGRGEGEERAACAGEHHLF